jgi:hypothetical protein
MASSIPVDVRTEGNLHALAHCVQHYLSYLNIVTLISCGHVSCGEAWDSQIKSFASFIRYKIMLG